MKKKSYAATGRLTVLLIVISVFVNGCERRKKSALIWSTDFPVIGSQSSPRATDLNGDGVLDIVIGAGKNEFQKTDQGILALDGASGEILWQQEAVDQVYGSPTFLDVTGDGVSDVFIGGRSPQFKALDGRNGNVLWQFDSSRYKDHSILKFARYNFNNSVLVPDQNGNGHQDLLTINGGNSYAAPGSEINRFPAVMMILDAQSGEVIAADTMPDGRESYMSPVAFAHPGQDEWLVVFGTGGETVDGNLYVAALSDLRTQKLSRARVVATEKGHGFIAPPSVADVNGDDYYDIVAISHGSKAVAVDGRGERILWERTFPGTECSNSFAVGYFTGDDIPDFFTFVSKGVWPNSTGSLQVMLDGKDGTVAHVDSIGCTGFSSPVVYDLDNDGRDDAIISINAFDCALGFTGRTPSSIENRLIAIDFAHRQVRPIDQTTGLKNIFSTPWLGDLDDDGYLDIVHCQYYHYPDLLLFLGMRVKRIDTPVKIRQDVVWGSYMGSDGRGVFGGWR